MRVWPALLLALSIFAVPADSALGSEPKITPFLEAEAAFKANFPVDRRVTVQLLLTAIGYWNAVATENFSPRLFKAIQRFQSENGFPPTGVLERPQIERLASSAGAVYKIWGFKKVDHPSRKLSIWIPFGLGLLSLRSPEGLTFFDSSDRVTVDFKTYANISTSAYYEFILNKLKIAQSKIHYQIFKDNWFVISSTALDDVKSYYRFHMDAENVTGFILSWNNTKGNIFGDRIAVLMSSSLWSQMGGTRIIAPPTDEAILDVAKAEGAPQAAIPSNAQPSISPPNVGERPAVPEPPKASSGTGFFVGREGHILTNAHVTEGCLALHVKPDQGPIMSAILIAKDKVNDLAVIKVDLKPEKAANFKSGSRLGEQVAAFGYPLSNLLASTGNFSFGNITALAGIGDDTRELQISVPVQPGNSGGPLLDFSGNVVGIVASKLNAIKTASTNGDIPQNVNFAIKTSAVLSFLESKQVSFDSNDQNVTLSAPDLAALGKSISVFIRCN